MKKRDVLSEVYEEITGKRLDIEPYKLDIDFHVFSGDIKILSKQVRAILESRKRKGELSISNEEIGKVADRFVRKFKKEF